MNQEKDQQADPGDRRSTSRRNTSPPAIAHVLCGWPLLLVAVGGLIGGGLGGAAYGINLTVYQSKLPVLAKFGLNMLVGLAAVGLWLAIGVAIHASLQ